MTLFLSEEWFATVAAETPPRPGRPEAVLEQVVEGAPAGRVTYRVELDDSSARIVWPVPADAADPDLRVTCDWSTAVAVAKGELSTQRALMQGRLRVRGNPGRLSELVSVLRDVDPVPSSVRRSTTYATTS